MMKQTGALPLVALVLAVIASFSAQAQAIDEVENDEHEQGESPTTSRPYESSGPKVPREPRWSDFLPVLGEEARTAGYVLPRPFGISLGVIAQDQPFDVTSVAVNDINLSGPGVVQLEEIDNTETTTIARFDAWLLPFFNVYGILGQTEGRAEGPLTLDLNPFTAGRPLLQLLCKNSPGQCIIDQDIRLDYRGDVVGGGITLAGGYKDFFAMIDHNITHTDLNISSTDAKAEVTSARIGWNGSAGVFKGSLWLGAMHQDVAQTIDLLVPLNDQILRVSIDQSTQSAVNTLIGARWEFSPAFEAQLEFGFGERQSQMLNFSYRM